MDSTARDFRGRSTRTLGRPQGKRGDEGRRIRETSSAPVIILSAKGAEHEIARAFELGAADFLAKPFSAVELVARVKGALGRVKSSIGFDVHSIYESGDLRIDYG